MKIGKTKLIKQNIAPLGATNVVLFNSDNEIVCEMSLGHLAIPNNGDRMYSFLALSDVHQPYETALADHQKALSYASNSDEIDFVIETGDLTSTGRENEMQDWKACVDAYLPDKPMYAITGNHENYSARIETYTLSDYTGHPLYYSFLHGDDIFIMVGCYGWYEGDTIPPDNILTIEELQWLYETLEENRNRRCFVCFHVLPWGDCGNAAGLYTYNLFTGTKCQVFLSLIQHYKNVILFHGHSHLRYELQEIDKKANYSESNGYKSVHISSLAVPRDANASLDGYDEIFAESEGYVVDVYKNGIHLRAMNFVTENFIPIASYWVDTTLETVQACSYVDATGTIITNTKAVSGIAVAGRTISGYY